ncbi:MAG TPA: DUF459 domain-containing protein [Acidimicrobiia bacterium]|nr:DUF459 domain-containing protein [Acidimicrobiia bacterium]
MTDPARPPEEFVPDVHTRAARLARHRRHRHFLISATVALVVVGGSVAAVAFASQNAPTDPGASPGTEFGAVGKLPEIQAAAKAAETRALDHAHPLRLWIGGDSLAGSFGPSLGDEVGATGIVRTSIDYKVGSGLWAGGRDWLQRARDQMASVDPEVVVFIIGTNDTSIVSTYDRNGDGVPDWEPSYRSKIDTMLETFIGTGATPRTVLWLGAPTLGDSRMDRGAVAINRVAQQEAAKYADHVVYVDTYRLFTGPNGGYARDILDENGHQIDARVSDGVHFTASGAQYLARAVFTLLDTQWHITKQADTAEPIGWNFASGSGENVPGYGHPYSRYGSSTTVAAPTTSPATAPPTTVPLTTPPTTVPVTTAQTTIPVTTPPTTS